MSPGAQAASGTAGLVVVDKPPGFTSHDVVAIVKKLYSAKAGHAGTLDPSATGVLLVGLGRATRLLSFMHNLAKTYQAEVRFGVETSTQDADGEVTAEFECSFAEQELHTAAHSFVGEIQQVPPMVSAVKVGGEALYKAARRGETVERKPRTVRVYSLTIDSFDATALTATMTIGCSSGTYIRSIASDLGRTLGCGAHLTRLRRTSIGSFRVEDAVPLADLRAALEENLPSFVMTPAEAMRDFPVLYADDQQRRAVSHGKTLPAGIVSREGELPITSSPRPGQRPAHEAGMSAGIPVAIIDSGGDLIAVYRKAGQDLRPAAVLI